MTDASFDHQAVPLQIDQVRLKVRDLTRMSDFYQRVIGLGRIDQTPGRVMLGAGQRPLLELAEDANARHRNPRAAGLFHLALLLPDRAALGCWLTHALTLGVPLQGAADHIVSEAVYLTDPEGNGIELYCDRPVADWRDARGELQMATMPLDSSDLLSVAGTVWAGFPAAGAIGHVHLQVGDTDATDRFYRDVVGFELTSRLPGASFFGSGGYHHQLAGNTWNSRGAGPRPVDMAGLEAITLRVREPANCRDILNRAEQAGVTLTASAPNPVLQDPSGLQIELTT